MYRLRAPKKRLTCRSESCCRFGLSEIWDIGITNQKGCGALTKNWPPAWPTFDLLRASHQRGPHEKDRSILVCVCVCFMKVLFSGFDRKPKGRPPVLVLFSARIPIAPTGLGPDRQARSPTATAAMPEAWGGSGLRR